MLRRVMTPWVDYLPDEEENAHDLARMSLRLIRAVNPGVGKARRLAEAALKKNLAAAWKKACKSITSARN